MLKKAVLEPKEQVEPAVAQTAEAQPAEAKPAEAQPTEAGATAEEAKDGEAEEGKAHEAKASALDADETCASVLTCSMTEELAPAVDLELGLPAEAREADEEVKDGAAGRAETRPRRLGLARQRLLSTWREAKRRDPVRKGRCSLGSLGFCTTGLLGLVFLGVGLRQLDVWEILACLLIMGLSGYGAVFLGGDLCLQGEYLQEVNSCRKENSRFKESNARLEGALRSMEGIRDGLEEVQAKMEGDEEAATWLLKSLERYSVLQTISVVVNQFFSADWDGSGHVCGDEAMILVPQLSSLWALIPAFDSERLLLHVKLFGITLGQLVRLLDRLVAGDAVGCERELEKIIASFRLKPVSSEMPPHEDLYEDAQLEELYEETQLAASSVKDWLEKNLQLPEADEDIKVLQPWLKCRSWNVWSPLHLGLTVSTVAGAVFVVASLVMLEFTNIVGGLICLALATGLMVESRLIEVLKALRAEAVSLSCQNDRLQVVHDELHKQVSHMAKLKKGYQTLGLECGGNVNKARELVRRSHTDSTMSAMTVITQLFREADRKRTITEEERDEFVKRLQVALHCVEGFDVDGARRAATGRTAPELRSLVNIVMVEAPAVAEAMSVPSVFPPPAESNTSGTSELLIVQAENTSQAQVLSRPSRDPRG